MHDLPMYRHSVYDHPQSHEVAISRPVSPAVGTDTTADCECDADGDPWVGPKWHYDPTCPFYAGSAA